MDTTQDITDDEVATVEETARSLLNDRIAVVIKLAKSKKQLAQIRTQLTEAEREYGSDYVAAQRAGWTEEELSRIGLGSPTRRPPGRPARTSRRRASTVRVKPRSSSGTGSESLATEASADDDGVVAEGGRPNPDIGQG